MNTLIASGDVYIRSEKPLQDIPNVDVVCYGLWVNPSLPLITGFCLKPEKPRSIRLHVTEALSGRIGRFIQDSPFPNGHRHLDF